VSRPLPGLIRTNDAADLRYVDEWNLRLDAELILRTFRVVLGTGE